MPTIEEMVIQRYPRPVKGRRARALVVVLRKLAKDTNLTPSRRLYCVQLLGYLEGMLSYEPEIKHLKDSLMAMTAAKNKAAGKMERAPGAQFTEQEELARQALIDLAGQLSFDQEKPEENPNVE